MLTFQISTIDDCGFWFQLMSDEQEILLVSELHPRIEYCISDVKSLIKRFKYEVIKACWADDGDFDFTLRDESGRVLARTLWYLKRGEKEDLLHLLKKNVRTAKIEIVNEVD